MLVISRGLSHIFPGFCPGFPRPRDCPVPRHIFATSTDFFEATRSDGNRSRRSQGQWRLLQLAVADGLCRLDPSRTVPLDGVRCSALMGRSWLQDLADLVCGLKACFIVFPNVNICIYIIYIIYIYIFIGDDDPIWQIRLEWDETNQRYNPVVKREWRLRSELGVSLFLRNIFHMQWGASWSYFEFPNYLDNRIAILMKRPKLR